MPDCVDSHDVPTDDRAIADETPIWRRISPQWWVRDENRGGFRVTSQAFQDHRNGSPMSVAIATECSEEEFIGDHAGYGIAQLLVGEARGCNQGVVRAPLRELPAHAHVVGKKNTRNRQCLRDAAQVIVEPAV